MDKASAYGAGDCRFESCRGHFPCCCVVNSHIHFATRPRALQVARTVIDFPKTDEVSLIWQQLNKYVQTTGQRCTSTFQNALTHTRCSSQASPLGSYSKVHMCISFSRAHGVVVSHPLRIRKALGSNPSVSIFPPASARRDYRDFQERRLIAKVFEAGLEPAISSLGGRRLIH